MSLPVRRLTPTAALAAALLLPATALGASDANSAGAPPEATVKIRVGHLDGGKARIMSTVPVVGTLSPFVPGQRVEVSFYRDGKRIARRTVPVGQGKGGAGAFRAEIRIEKAGRYAASAAHLATATLGGDSTVRKSWAVEFPALGQGKCGEIVVGFKRALRRMGYIANDGPCFGGKTARGVLAYRKVNGMSRTSRAGKRLVERVFAGRGGYRVRHPGAGVHVEVPLAKQVMVFADGDKPVAIYPISSGKSATPTVTGRFRFIRTEPGYNSLGMYYSYYFHGGYAVHGFKSVPDYPASHGCIRTFIADQPEIYERIELGESIFVF